MFSFFKRNKKDSSNSEFERFLHHGKEMGYDMNHTGIITTPLRLDDTRDILKMSKVGDIQTELIFLKNYVDIDSTTKGIKYWINYIHSTKSCFFKTIRLVYLRNNNYSIENSLFVGFIALLPVEDFSEIRNVGSNRQLIFATLPQFRRKGFMKTALDMTLDSMHSDGYNICSACRQV